VVGEFIERDVVLEVENGVGGKHAAAEVAAVAIVWEVEV
jgi:hypothetical protein